jgi:hypothetical protein
MTVQNLRAVYGKYNVTHIDIGFVDYGKFVTKDLDTAQQAQKAPLWERYIFGLVEGTLQDREVANEVSNIPPEMLAQFLNKSSVGNMKEESYDKVITAYMRKSGESAFSGQDLKRLLEFIEHLRPDLKERFISSTVKNFSEDTQSAYQGNKKMTVEEIERFLGMANKHMVSIPPVLSGLIEKYAFNAEMPSDAVSIEEDITEDEEYNLDRLAELFSEEKPQEGGETINLQEIQALLDYDASELKTSQFIEFENEFNEELTEKRFHQIILELMVSRTVSADDYQVCVNKMREQSQQLLWTGQYGMLLDMLKIIESNKEQNRFAEMSSTALQYYHSTQFIQQIVQSFKLLGRQLKKEVWMLCDYYDREMIPYLLDALMEEESQIVRRFLMDVLKQFGDKINHEAVKRLHDDRWFVKRNMLYILQDTDSRGVSESIRPYCLHENRKVSIAALKCLLNNRDPYAIEIIREHLYSDSKELFEQAVALSSSFKLEEVVDDLIILLKKQERSGADILRKIPVVKALGDIADPRALESLRSLISSTSIFFKKILDQLKEEIYKTLKYYPYELVTDLIEDGTESRNDVIRKESLLLRRVSSE